MDKRKVNYVRKIGFPEIYIETPFLKERIGKDMEYCVAPVASTVVVDKIIDISTMESDSECEKEVSNDEEILEYPDEILPATITNEDCLVLTKKTVGRPRKKL